jgi:CheY-like chemotaxis protein
MVKKIFVVDDDLGDQEFLEAAFDEIGFHGLEVFSDVYSIVHKLKAMEPHLLPQLIITDYKMPTLDGFNLLSFIKKSEKLSSIKVVILTGSIAENEKHRLVSAGVTKIVIKPASVIDYKNMALELRDLVA